MIFVDSSQSSTLYIEVPLFFFLLSSIYNTYTLQYVYTEGDHPSINGKKSVIKCRKRPTYQIQRGATIDVGVDLGYLLIFVETII